jgi:hypothetical protein
MSEARPQHPRRTLSRDPFRLASVHHVAAVRRSIELMESNCIG